MKKTLPKPNFKFSHRKCFHYTVSKKKDSVATIIITKLADDGIFPPIVVQNILSAPIINWYEQGNAQLVMTIDISEEQNLRDFEKYCKDSFETYQFGLVNM